MMNSPALTALVLRTVASIPESGRFGRKVFLASIFAALPSGTFLDVAAFRRWCLEANRAGTLILARADLVAAMPRALVQASEFSDRGADYHVVLDPAHREPWER